MSQVVSALLDQLAGLDATSLLWIIAVVFIAVVMAVLCVITVLSIRRMRGGSPADATHAQRTAAAYPAHGRDVARIDDEIKAVRTRIETVAASIPRAAEVDAVTKGVDDLRAEFNALSTSVKSNMESFRRSTAEDLDKSRRAMGEAAEAELVDKAAAILERNGVPRAEFDALRERFDRVHGADESEERMGVLSRLFESDRLKVLNWQCKLIRLLKGGLAPDAEQDIIVSEGIPESAFKKFLKRLVDHGIAESRSVRAYYLEDEYEWIYTYTDRPDWLHRRLQGAVKRESDYGRYIGKNAGLIEDGLIVEATEYQLDTGRLDLVCRDTVGRTVGIELKYPAAAVPDKRQVASYRDDYKRRSGMAESRFMLVAPRIPGELKRLLEQDGIEYREIPMAAEDAGAGAGVGKE